MSGINPQTFAVTKTIQSFTATVDGIYDISAIGGSGGLVLNSQALTPGFASLVDGWFHLNANTQVFVVVGQAGSNIDANMTLGGAGGGGASYVYYLDQTAPNPSASPILLEAAAGGGGASKTTLGIQKGYDALGIIPNASPHPAVVANDFIDNAGGGGGDFLQNGYSVGNLDKGGIGGNGLFPVAPHVTYTPFWGGQNSYSQGGYGGGGSGDFNVGYGGGGGGYIGGAGGFSGIPQGSGGASYLAQSATNGQVQAGSWASGDGQVTISLVRQNIPPVNSLATEVMVNTVAYDTGANESAGFVARLYDSVLNRAGDAVGTGFWINALDKGVSKTDVTSAFLGSTEYKTAHAVGVDDKTFIQELYNNALERNPHVSEATLWAQLLSTGTASKAEIAAAISESTEAVSHNIQLIANGIHYQEWAEAA